MQCPNSHTIESFLGGTLGSKESLEIETHLEGCADCQQAMAEFAGATPLPQDDTDATSQWRPDVAKRLAIGLHGVTQDSNLAAQDSNELRLPFRVGTYELQEVIGRGGMGTVYRAQQSKLNRTVAVKMIVQQHLKPSYVDRFYIEAQSAGKLDHPGIVPVFDVEHFGPYVYYAMALVPGGTLGDLTSDQQLSPRRAAEIVKTISEAIQYAHDRGVIHRDLKPSNILMEADGHPRIGDFGLAKQVESSTDLTASGDVLGTPGYMPPEQASGQAAVTTAADIYGVGAILYYLLAGRPPFDGDDPVAVIYRVVNEEPASIMPQSPDTPLDLETIALHCLAKRPQDRYESAAEVARELGRFLTGQPIQVKPPSAIGRLLRWCRRYPAMATMTSTAVCALIAGTIVSTHFGLLANQRSQNLTHVNESLMVAERNARRAADDAKIQADLATSQATVTLGLLESTLYELQPVLSDDMAQQQRRRQLLTSVLQGLDSLHAQFADDRRVRRCRANTLLGLAAVAHQLGDQSGRTGLTASRPLYIEAIRQLQYLARGADDDRFATKDLIAALTEFGDMLAESGEWLEAGNQFKQALPVVEKMAAERPDDPIAQGKFAELEVFYGETLMRTGQQQSAGQLFESARQRCMDVLRRNPNNAFVRGELIHVTEQLGDWHLRQNDPTSAAECFQQMRREAQANVNQQPGNGAAIMDMSSALERLGLASDALEDSDLALDYYTESLKFAEAAGRLAPDNDHVQWQLSFSYQQLAGCYLRANRNEEARKNALQCVQIRSRLAKADSTNSQLYTKLFHAQKTLATTWERDGQITEAIKCHKQRIQFAQQFHKATDSNRYTDQVKQAEAEIERLTSNLQTSG